ncbi:LysR family transcriptional regulator [Neptunicella marina]|uniref:LysR family transcriptional regulator n=1 Tax=Neptunicella marina TaxID=2125989 RepID=A0A8J6ITM0_9ALTE|nr:LysR family transcriptional regulator [Neptunicella marina]MBC3765582.1 LysR family transcriptional regulator [Neptunicella marina]
MNTANHLSFKQLQLLVSLNRHQQHSRVADELNISISAVSHQLKRIEQQCGFAITEKHGRQLFLTDSAKKFASELAQHFTAIEQLSNQFTQSEPDTIQIGVDSALAMNRFTQALSLRDIDGSHSDIRVRMLQCNDDPVALGLDMVLGQRIVNPHYQSELLQREQYIAVCSPEYEQGLQQNQHWLPQATLLTLEDVNEWDFWLNQFSPNSQGGKQRYFSHTILLLQAVLNHQGVALLEQALVKEQLAQNQLIKIDPNALIVPERAYYLSVRKPLLQHSAVKQECSWIKRWL